MNNAIKNLLIFSAGAAIGVASTWKILESKYKKIADEEIASVKDVFSKRAKEEHIIADVTEETVSTEEKVLYSNYTNIVNENYSKKGEENMVKPYVIPPDEFGELHGYETVSLNYYADEVLTDDRDNIVEDVEYLVGKESLDHFGEYEDDSVFVRNDVTKCDYEILADSRNYYDIYGHDANE